MHQTKHPPMGWGVSTDSKSSNGIEISWFVKVLLCFYWFCVRWVGVQLGVGQPPCTCAHTCTYTHTHMCAHTCIHVKHDKHGCLHGGGHLQFPNMFILVFHACACMHMHVHMSRDSRHAPRFLPTHLPPPQSRREPESLTVYKSWTNQDNSILFEKSLPLNIPELI